MICPNCKDEVQQLFQTTYGDLCRVCKCAVRIAARVNNLYATTYMDVSNRAGPWGTLHDKDVAGVAREEIIKSGLISI